MWQLGQDTAVFALRTPLPTISQVPRYVTYLQGVVTPTFPLRCLNGGLRNPCGLTHGQEEYCTHPRPPILWTYLGVS